MKKIFILLVVFAFAFTGCKKSGTAGDAGSSSQSAPSSSSAANPAANQAITPGSVKLTNDQIIRYIDTLPAFTKIAVRMMGNNPNRLSSVEATKMIEKLVMDKGWSSLPEFYAVNGKIAKAMGWVSYNQNAALMRNMTPEMRAQRDQQFETQMKDFSAEEKSLIQKHSAKLYSAMMSAALGR